MPTDAVCNDSKQSNFISHSATLCFGINEHWRTDMYNQMIEFEIIEFVEVDIIEFEIIDELLRGFLVTWF